MKKKSGHANPDSSAPESRPRAASLVLSPGRINKPSERRTRDADDAFQASCGRTSYAKTRLDSAARAHGWPFARFRFVPLGSAPPVRVSPSPSFLGQPGRLLAPVARSQVPTQPGTSTRPARATAS